MQGEEGPPKVGVATTGRRGAEAQRRRGAAGPTATAQPHGATPRPRRSGSHGALPSLVSPLPPGSSFKGLSTSPRAPVTSHHRQVASGGACTSPVTRTRQRLSGFSGYLYKAIVRLVTTCETPLCSVLCACLWPAVSLW